MSARSERPPADKRIEDTYTVERAIGSGTFGDVLKARLRRDPRRVVAIKQLRNVADDPMSMTRLRETIFFRHVRQHPNLVTLYDMFRDSDSATMVYVLEYMDGTLLHFMEQACRAQGGPLDWFLVAGIVKDLLKGVEHIHASGFVHRDLKPENILFSADIRGHMVVKIADFGLSRPIEDAQYATARWTSYVATRWYRAPEQILGLNFHTSALDIWAISLILYELCNQTPMFPGRTTFEMTALQVQALGLPRKNSAAGPCAAVTHQLSNMPEWKLVYGDLLPQRWLSLVRWSEHAIFRHAMEAGLRWDPAARPSASQYLLEIRRSIQDEWKRRGRSRFARRRFGLPTSQPRARKADQLGINERKRPPTA